MKDMAIMWLDSDSNLFGLEVSELGNDGKREGSSYGNRSGDTSSSRSHGVPIRFLFYSEKSRTPKIWTCEYKEAQCVTLSPADTGNWAVRVIKNGRTRITDAELTEFLGITKSSSFGFFKIAEKDRTRVYFIALSKEEHVIC
jgi:hypothetical protein